MYIFLNVKQYVQLVYLTIENTDTFMLSECTYSSLFLGGSSDLFGQNIEIYGNFFFKFLHLAKVGVMLFSSLSDDGTSWYRSSLVVF